MTGKDPSFTLVQLRYFAAAADLGSMTAASKVLMVSQSAVSTAVAQLEKELGVQLLIRQHARGLELTPAGRNFRQELRSFLNHSVELADSAARLGNSLIGDLTIGCFSTIAPFGLPTLLAGKPEAEAVQKVANTLAIVSSIGTVCELPTITKFFNGNPTLSSVNSGAAEFSGKAGAKRLRCAGAIFNDDGLADDRADLIGQIACDGILSAASPL